MANKSNSGIGVLTVLQIVFLVLKLADLVAWSWPVVLIPLWIWFGLIFLSALILAVIGVFGNGR